MKCLYREVRRRIARIHMAEASLGPHGFEWKQEIRRHRHVHHDAAENFRWLAHSSADESEEAEPEDEQDAS